ncbi:hypothetical protein TWF481_010466 [Arthrobotrys musiformis]|uniref:Nephrocystin 3-like N-terminal domain-containing protein n=1 Tax=Arthrobotrys musiformis TaxID=47236 RepID=A0AAV9W381_9PEZI
MMTSAHETLFRVQIRKINRKLDFAALPTAEGAAYGSFKDQHEPKCLENTRVKLLEDIKGWVKDPQGKCVFWLSGMAGTGKSTISRTVAKQLEDEGLLASSFFFRRGERDRGDASKFFTTLATQLANYIDGIVPSIQKVIDEYPNIATIGHREQFDKLILNPLLEQTRPSSPQSPAVSQPQPNPPLPTKAILVIDALDECDRDQDQELIVSLLARLSEIESINMRVFLTSRPELKIRMGFERLTGDTHQNMVLHQIPGIKEDITLFLEAELGKIRSEYGIRSEWPGNENISKLAAMAVPLFIFASTACRFIGQSDPEEQINIVLSYQNKSIDNESSEAPQLEPTYLPILHRLKQNAASNKSIIREFRQIVGTIINLESPLSIPALSGLLAITDKKLHGTLKELHSVLEVPNFGPRITSQSAPVRMLHLSLRDFLSGGSLRDNVEFHDFWIEEKEAHRNIYTKCIELMSKTLRRDICDLKVPGTSVSEVDQSIIEENLQTEIQYSCRYWVYHLERSGDKIRDGGLVDVFLRKHILHWLEALSLSGEMNKAASIVDILNAVIDGQNGESISALAYDIKRFVRQNQTIINTAPLQVYWSALLFAPEKSIIKSVFSPRDIIPEVEPTRLPLVQEQWGAVLQTLEGHTDTVRGLAFSANDKFLASGSGDRTVRIWDVATGALLHIFRGQRNWVNDVIFYTIGAEEFVASASNDKTVALWSLTTGALVRTLAGHEDWVRGLASTKQDDMVVLASASDDSTVRIWDAASGALVRVLGGHGRYIYTVAFSSDGKMLASGLNDGTCMVWDAIGGVLLHKIKFDGEVKHVAFSAKTNILACLISDGAVEIVGAATGSSMRRLRLDEGRAVGMAFSMVTERLMLVSDEGAISVLDVATGAVVEEYEGGRGCLSVALSNNGKILALAGSRDFGISIREMAIGSSSSLPPSKLKSGLTVAADGKTLASIQSDATISIWDMATGDLRRTTKPDTDGVSDGSLALSSDGKFVAADVKQGYNYGNSEVVVWNTATGELLQALGGHSDWIECVVFSPNDEMMASSSRDQTIRIWNTSTWDLLHVLRGHRKAVRQIAFAPDGKSLASASIDETIKIWNPATGILLQTLSGHRYRAWGVAFSADGKMLASSSGGDTIKVWDVATWAQQQEFSTKSTPQSIFFSKDDRYIITRGTMAEAFALNSNQSPPASSDNINSHKHKYEPIVINNQWVVRAGKKLLYLPGDHNPFCEAVYDDTVCLAHGSGDVSILKFKDPSLYSSL